MKKANITKVKPVANRSATTKYKPLLAEQWKDLEKLFGKRGACGGCWCMWARLRRADYIKNRGAGNKASFKKIVNAGPAPGVLAYRGKTAIGWCAVAPREMYLRLEKSRTLARVDEQPVWSLNCLFVAMEHRRAGVSVGLIKAATAYAAKNGAQIVEGYPVEPISDKMPDAFAWTGLVSAFLKAGFVEVERRSKTRPIVRCVISK